jgi:hypothetical protein
VTTSSRESSRIPMVLRVWVEIHWGKRARVQLGKNRERWWAGQDFRTEGR